MCLNLCETASTVLRARLPAYYIHRVAVQRWKKHRAYFGTSTVLRQLSCRLKPEYSHIVELCSS
uniref:Uncharacterized protein n=1 Tax=Arundo donax TaxID=35708 RepID=A0A0A8ZZR1_ARUDO